MMFFVQYCLNHPREVHAVGGIAHVGSDLLHDLIQEHGFRLVVEDHGLRGKTRRD